MTSKERREVAMGFSLFLLTAAIMIASTISFISGIAFCIGELLVFEKV
jgi:hypothetical protein